MIPSSAFDISVFVRLGDKINAPLKDMENVIAKASDRMNKRLRLSMKLAGAGAVASGVAFGARRMVSGFTDSIREVERAKGELATLGVTDLAAVVDRAREMQGQLAGITAGAFVRASYDIKSGISGLSDQGVADMTATAMITAKATKGQAEQMTSLFATSYGIFKSQFSNLTDAEFGEQFGASLAKAVQQFKTDGGSMQQAIESAGAGAVNLGMEMSEQLTLLGMMQQQMQSGEAGTALRAFATNAAKAHKTFADMQVSTERPVRVRILDENGELRAMPDVLADLQARYGETLDAFEAAEIKDAFGTDEAMKMINALYGQADAVRANQDALEGAAEQGNAFTTQMARAADSNWDSTIVLLSQKMDVLKQKIGDRLLPVVTKFIPVIESIISKTMGWVDANPELATTIGAVIAGIGGLAVVMAPVLIASSALVGTFALLSNGATRLGLGTLKLAVGTAKFSKGLFVLGRKALPLVGKAIMLIGRALLANPIGLAIAVIAGGAALIYKYWDPLSSFFSDLWGSVKSAVSNAWTGIKSVFLQYTPHGLIYTYWDSITGWFAGVWNKIKSGISWAWDGIKALFLNYTPLGIVINNWGGITETFAGYWKTISGGVSTGWEAIKTALSEFGPTAMIYDAWMGLPDWFGTLWDNVKAKFSGKWGEISANVATWPAKMYDYGADIIQRLIDGIKARFASLTQAVSDALAKLNPFSNVQVNIAGLPSGSGPSNAAPNSASRNKALRDLYGLDGSAPGMDGPLQTNATGGGFRAGWHLVGERGPELKYETHGGYIAHNGALRGMLSMAQRTRDLANGVGMGDGLQSLATSSVPSLAMSGSGQGSHAGKAITYAPTINMPITMGAGADLEELRAMVQATFEDHAEQAQVNLRRLLND